MERLTVNDLDKFSYDPWELCGMDGHCTKGTHEKGGCIRGCKIIRMYRKLSEYENLEEQCIKETTWSLRMLLEKWKEFFEDITELYDYKKLKEQGLLLKLPCKVGDKLHWYDALREYREDIVNCIYVEHDLSGIKIETLCCQIDAEEIGKTVFLTELEAEEALKRMEGDE